MLLSIATFFLALIPVEARHVQSERAACDAVKARMAAAWNIPDGLIAFCDIIPADSSPMEFYVMGLHSNRVCGGICSTNMGWFAIHKKTGRIYEWDVGEQRLGPSLRRRR